jgi:hypothetical protein
VPSSRDPSTNEVTERPRICRRFDGDDWQAFDALPPAMRRRMHEHAHDAWTVNALILWRRFRRQTASSERGLRRLLNHLNDCEALECPAFADAHACLWDDSLSASRRSRDRPAIRRSPA